MSDHPHKYSTERFIITDRLFGDDVKWLTGTKLIFELKAEFCEHAQVKRWCEENCTEVTTFVANEGGSEFICFFSEEDAAAFKLVWDEQIYEG